MVSSAYRSSKKYGWMMGMRDIGLSGHGDELVVPFESSMSPGDLPSVGRLQNILSHLIKDRLDIKTGHCNSVCQ